MYPTELIVIVQNKFASLRLWAFVVVKVLLIRYQSLTLFIRRRVHISALCFFSSVYNVITFILRGAWRILW